MSSAALVKWALKAMLTIQPAAVTPWADTYQDTAEVFAKVAEEQPLFKGDDGVQRTLSWFISTAWFEGRFDPRAKGDCTEKDKAGKCISPPQSLCMFQVGVSNLSGLGLTAEEILGSTEVCTRAARKLMKISMGVCKARPMEEWLGHYASGGGTCAGLKESRHRVTKAKWVFANVKTPE